jgi:N-acetylmuramoyl-L-alanine amidase
VIRWILTSAALVVLHVAAVAAPEVAADFAQPRPTHVIVIDPGHGGSNTGGVNQGNGLREKDVTLDLAQRVAKNLRALQIGVLLTRDSDQTLTLRQRMLVASRASADLFLSIHTNASPSRTQRGYETYVLTPTAVDVDARALRRDATTPRQGIAPQLGLMLDDIERGAAQWDSAEFAAEMQDQLQKVRGKEGNRGVRQDAQHVLLGATMPAILVEVGFLDHPIEGKELEDDVVKDKLADAMTRAILAQWKKASAPATKNTP